MPSAWARHVWRGSATDGGSATVPALPGKQRSAGQHIAYGIQGKCRDLTAYMAKVQLRFCGSDVGDRRDYCFRWGCIGN